LRISHGIDVNIYLACTVRGDRAAVVALRRVADRLEREGHHVLTRHLLDDDVEAAEASVGDRDVFTRDLEWLHRADVLIAERSGQRVLLVYDAARRGRVSRLISGNAHPHCTTFAYQNPTDLERVVQAFLAPVPEH
jgi:hypothetical protein